jgi:membrane protein implicated in regulation of membrane protease activity
MSAETASEAEEARRSHSILSGVRDAVLVWYALIGSIGAWTIHLVLFAAFVEFSCNEEGTTWVMHLATVVTLAMTVVAMVLCRRMMRGAEADESSDEEGGRAQFLGRLGLIIGASNFALIALEELYLIVLNSRRCG